jgi:hypothetical protein
MADILSQVTQRPNINAFHALIVGPALAYIGWENYNGKPIGPSIAILLIIVAIIVIIYHLAIWNQYGHFDSKLMALIGSK